MGDVLLYAVGDIAPDRDDPNECFDLVREDLRKADIVFCQLETNLTERGVRLPQARHAVRGSPKIAPALVQAGFSVVSFAGNHCMDFGNDAFFDTIENLQQADLAVVGVGANIRQAREPVVSEVDGQKVAFLAYSSILPMTYWAEASRPGCAPMRAWTHYEQIEHDQPGTPARIHTYPHRDDLTAMEADIRAAREKADVVIVSHHWGIHFVPAVIADYQRDVAHAAIDAGADLILGHHAHILKGVEVYKDKAIFYSLCNFACDLRMDEAHANSKSFKEIQTLSPKWIPDFESLYNFPEDARKTVIVKAIIRDGAIAQVSILPCWVNRNAQPERLLAADPRFAEVSAYLAEISADQGLNGQFNGVGDELLVTASKTS